MYFLDKRSAENNARFALNVLIFITFGRAELQNIFIKAKHHDRPRAFPGEGFHLSSPSDDATVTRRQALERFGIDLSTVGAMTKARINSLRSGTPRAHGVTGSPLETSDIDRVENNAHSSGALRKSKVRYRKMRGCGGNVADNRSNEAAAIDKRQEIISSRLRLLDSLISEGSLGTTRESGNIRSPHEDHASEGSAPSSTDGDSGVGSSPASLDDVREEVRALSKSSLSNVTPIPAVEDHSIGHHAALNECIDEVDSAVTDIQAPQTIQSERIRRKAAVNTPQGTKLRAENVEREISDKGLPKHRSSAASLERVKCCDV